MIDVVKDVLARVPGPPEQIIVLLQPTQPFRKPTHIHVALKMYEEHPSGNPVVSITAVPQGLNPAFMCWIGELSGYLCPFDVKRGLLGGDPRDWSEVPRRRQDQPTEFYVRDGTVYVFRRSTVERWGNLYGPCCFPLIIPSEETCALDTLADWAAAERRMCELGMV